MNAPNTRVLYPGSFDEQIAEWNALTLEDMKKYHAGFYGAQFAELVVVGQVDQAALLKEAEALLGVWKTPAAFVRMTGKHRDVAAFNEKIETPDKENAMFRAGMRVKMNDADPDAAALDLADFMFGGGLASRLFNRIRNVEGLSYGVNSSLNVPAEGDAASFAVGAIANPANTPKVEKIFMEELNKALKDGFTAAELDAAKKALKDRATVSRSSDQALLRTIAAREQRGRTLGWDEQFEARTQAVTLEEVNAAFRRHIDPARLSIVKAGDFKKAGVWQ